jgi:hypothetical protein
MARLGTHGGSGDEGRIRAQYRSEVKTWDYRNGDPRGNIWMYLARRWKRPIKEIRRIVGKEKK